MKKKPRARVGRAGDESREEAEVTSRCPGCSGFLKEEPLYKKKPSNLEVTSKGENHRLLWFCVHSFWYLFIWSKLEHIHYMPGRYLALFLHPGIFSLSSSICGSNNNKGSRLGLNWYCKSSVSTFPNTRRFLPLPSGNAGSEHDVLRVVFQIVLISNIYPFKQRWYLILKGHPFCWPGTWLRR